MSKLYIGNNFKNNYKIKRTKMDKGTKEYQQICENAYKNILEYQRNNDKGILKSKYFIAK